MHGLIFLPPERTEWDFPQTLPWLEFAPPPLPASHPPLLLQGIHQRIQGDCEHDFDLYYNVPSFENYLRCQKQVK